MKVKVITANTPEGFENHLNSLLNKGFEILNVHKDNKDFVAVLLKKQGTVKQTKTKK